MAKILQFGTGRFLRGFFDCVVDAPRSIAVVQSRRQSDGAALINACQDGYHVWTRGKQNGKVVDSFEIVRSLDRAWIAGDDWPSIVDFAAGPDLQLIVSNTTERGLALDVADESPVDFLNQCPASYPAKILAILFERYSQGRQGITILPLELVEYNAARLLELVRQQATLWPATRDAGFLKWLETENRWLSNLVDRIVVGVTDPQPWSSNDPLAVVAEPFRMLAVEDDGQSRDVLPNHDMVRWVPDLDRWFLRKVRILNGLHTAMVAHSLPRGFATVLEAVSDTAERAWLDALLNEEILPALDTRGFDERAFAAEVMERFENPFFEHRLADIAVGHDNKLMTRIAPTIEDFRNHLGRTPERLNLVMQGTGKP